MSSTKDHDRDEGTNGAEPQAADTQLPSQMERQQTLIAGAVKSLDTAMSDLDRATDYFYTALQALKSDGVGGMEHIVRVLDDTYCQLVDDVLFNLRNLSKELGAGDPERCEEASRS